MRVVLSRVGTAAVLLGLGLAGVFTASPAPAGGLGRGSDFGRKLSPVIASTAPGSSATPRPDAPCAGLRPGCCAEADAHGPQAAPRHPGFGKFS